MACKHKYIINEASGINCKTCNHELTPGTLLQMVEMVNQGKNYPNNPIWTYCIFLGKYWDYESCTDYDLGVYISPHESVGEISAAIAFGERPGDYLSGELSCYIRMDNCKLEYHETIKRARAWGLID